MFLKKSHKDGRTYLSIMEGYRKDGKSRSRTVESLGYLDVLEKLYDDPIAHFKAYAKEMTERKKAAEAPVAITIHPAEKIDKRVGGRRKNIGCAVGLSHYNSLSIEQTLRNAARRRRFDYDPNAILRLMVTERMLDPGSKLSDFENRLNYFFRCDFTEDDLYRSLNFISECKDKVIAAMNRQIESAGKRDMGSVFYDVTNYYFEIDHEDEIRRKGVSKDKSKRDKPIIQMGLLQDKNAIPITYKTFAGNVNDFTTLMPTLKDLKKSYKLTDVVVVADKGINCSNNIAACILDGNDYVFSQSIRGTKSTDELRRWVLSDAGYKESKDGDFKVKSRLTTKTIHITDDEGRGIGDVDVDIKVVAFWSKKYEARSRKKRAEVIAKALELVRSPAKYNKATHYGAAKYVSNVTFDKKTGEVLEDADRHASLNEVAISKAEELDGYYLIITSKTEWSNEKIIDTYKGLWRIEEAFKITKSDIAERPIYVSTPKHIEAHFLVCYIALTILRLIQFDTAFAYSAGSIISELAAMSGTHEEGAWWLFDHRTDISDALCASVGIDLTKRRMRLQEIKDVLAQVNGKQARSTT